MNEIQTVKIQGQGYLLNGSMSVPKADGNREYELIKEWLSEGNTPEPEFTDEELDTIELNKKISEAKQYLEATDFKMTTDYDKDVSEVKVKRAEAREFIRANQGVTE